MADKVKILVTGHHLRIQEEGQALLTRSGKKIQWLEVDVLKFDRLKIEDSIVLKVRQEPFDWIVFSSPRAVRFWTETLLEKDIDFPIETQVACLGQETAEAASLDGYTPDFFPTEPGTETFLSEFHEMISNNAKKPSVLVPSSVEGRKTLIEKLNEWGCRVSHLPLYQSLAVSEKPNISLNGISLYLFTSPSSFDAFTKHFKCPEGVPIAAMGEYTSQHLSKKGLPHSILPQSDFLKVGELL